MQQKQGWIIKTDNSFVPNLDNNVMKAICAAERNVLIRSDCPETLVCLTPLFSITKTWLQMRFPRRRVITVSYHSERGVQMAEHPDTCTLMFTGLTLHKKNQCRFAIEQGIIVAVRYLARWMPTVSNIYGICLHECVTLCMCVQQAPTWMG